MIHWTTLLLASAGATATRLKRPIGKRAFRSNAKRFDTFLATPEPLPLAQILLPSVTASDRGRQQMAAPNFAPTLDVLEEPAELESSHTARRLLASTGTVGLAVGAQWGALWLAPISIVTMGALAAPIFVEAYTATVKEGKLKVDVLDTTIITLCLGFGQLGAAAFMIWIPDVADLLLERTTRKSRQYVTEVFGKQARFAWLVVDGQEAQVAVHDLKQGDKLSLAPASKYPLMAWSLRAMPPLISRV